MSVSEDLDRERALTVLRWLSGALCAVDPDSVSKPHLGEGAAGLALAHAELSRLFGTDHHLATAQRYLKHAVAALTETPMHPAFHHGFVGIAWVYEYLGNVGLREEDGGEGAQEIDEELFVHVASEEGRSGEYCVSGLVGIGLYALERFPREGGVELLRGVIKALTATATECAEGLCWQTRIEWLTPQAVRLFAATMRARHPEASQGMPDESLVPTWNLSLANGMASVISFLAAAHATRVRPAATLRLLDGVIRWFIAQRLPPTSLSRYPGILVTGLPPCHARVAWCYGDPGVAVALVMAGRAAGRDDWIREGIETGLSAARRPESTTGVTDAGICHGAAGLHLVFRRLFAYTGEAVFWSASNQWADRLLSFRREGQGVAGFVTPDEEYDTSDPMAQQTGLLRGASGVALSLAALLGEPSDWDRALQLSARGLP